MIKHPFNPLLKFIDILTILLAWGTACYIRFNLFSNLELNVNTNMYILFGLLISLVCYFCMELSGVYKLDISTSIFSTYKIGVLPIIKGAIVAFSISVIGIHFLARDSMSRSVILLFFLIMILLLIVQRFIIKSQKKSLPKTKPLIIGNQKIAADIKTELENIGLEVAKIIPLEKISSEKLSDIIKELQIKDVLVCLDNGDSSSLNDILNQTSKENVYTHIVPNISHFAILALEIGTIGSFPILSVNQHVLYGFNLVIKRVLDLVTSVVALILFAPIFCCFSILIKLSSHGPVFYLQERTGMDGVPFKMYKFRSMKSNAEADTGPVWTTPDDSRTTAFGKFMRKTSLDELPQLINVLKGQMSIVGPRPERPVFVEKFKSEILSYTQRHKIKPGITGWAQINGYRGNTDINKRIKFDLHYINNWSIIFDLKIIILTFVKGFISKDAY